MAGIYAAIHAESSDAAFRWFRGFERAIYTLEENPRRCPATPETKDLRHLLYGKKPHVYRAIYRIAETRREIEILHIRHGAAFDQGQRTSSSRLTCEAAI